jgi:hypothetical protein
MRLMLLLFALATLAVAFPAASDALPASFCDRHPDHWRCQPPSPPPLAQCADSVDNDGDGLVDLADPGCVDAADNDETDSPLACAPVQNAWIAPQVQQTSNSYLYTPLSDSAAATCVAHVGEAVPGNAAANMYAPTDPELAAFHATLDNNGKTPDNEWWYPRYVTGRPGLTSPSTDDLIQWASHKWGIPEDWLRAQAVQESDWQQGALGDLRSENSADWQAYHDANPAYCPNSTQCYESVGLMQIKWQPAPRDEGAGTEPLRWKSTAFNLDYTAATERFYHDNPNGWRAVWGDASYRPLDDWLSVCAHFSPYPWGNSGQLSYCSSVQSHLAARDWPRP